MGENNKKYTLFLITEAEPNADYMKGDIRKSLYFWETCEIGDGDGFYYTDKRKVDGVWAVVAGIYHNAPCREFLSQSEYDDLMAEPEWNRNECTVT